MVLVACPGADPRGTWISEDMSAAQLGLPRRITTGSRNWIKSEVGNAVLHSTDPVLKSVVQRHPRQPLSWARQGIRKHAEVARVLVYDHGDVADDMGLKSLANNLLRVIHAETHGPGGSSRPIFFLCHSVGGLVVKVALTSASRSSDYQPLLQSCHGVGFFATPHRGSKFLAAEDYKPSITRLLRLARPLPPTLMREITLDNSGLLKIDEDFKELASEMRIWSFYEALDSKLSESGKYGPKEVPFAAPIASMRSALLGLRHEKVYGLQSIHANCAAFGTGRQNAETLRMFLEEFTLAVRAADELNRNAKDEMKRHTTGETGGNPKNYMYHLRLEQQDIVEVHGFYESTPSMTQEAESGFRVFTTKRSLGDFCDIGPGQLLQERLNAEDLTGTLTRAKSLIPPAARPHSVVESRVDGYRGEESTGFPLELSRSRSSVARSLPPTLGNSEQNNSGGLETSDFTDSRGGGLHPDSVREQGRVKKMVNSHRLSPAGPQRSATGTPLLTRSKQLQNGSMALANLEKGKLVNTARPPLTSEDEKPGELADVTKEPRQNVPTLPTLGSGLLTRRQSAALPSLQVQDHDSKMIEAIETQAVKPPTQTQLNKETPKFMWIHVPINNPSWVRKVFETLEVKQGRNFSELFNSEHWTTRHARGRHSQHHACFLKTTCAFTPLKLKLLQDDTAKTMSSPGGERSMSAGSIHQFPNSGCLYLYLPFLHFDSYKMLIRRREMIRRRVKQGRTRPVPRDVQENPSFELRMIWEFLGHDPPVNCRRTLDQYRYPSLRDTRARDDDQMLYKMTKQSIYKHTERRNAHFSSNSSPVYIERQPTQQSEVDLDDGDGQVNSDHDHTDSEQDSDLEESNDIQDVLDGNVLMIDQLWLWAVDTSKKNTSCFYQPRGGTVTTNRCWSSNSGDFLPFERRKSHGRTIVPASRSSRQHLQ